MAVLIPHTVKRLFWGDDARELSWPKHERYITKAVLEKGDQEDVRWLFTIKSKDELHRSLSSLTLSPKSKTFWTFYLS